jgi:hypothetical protein
VPESATRESADGRPPGVETTRLRRTVLCLAAVATVLVGLVVHFLTSGYVSDATADALYTVLVYLLVAAVVPRLRPVAVGGIAFAVSAGIEFLQLTGVPSALAEIFPPARLVLGTTFVATDLIFYAVGAVSAATLDFLTTRQRRSRRPGQDGTSRRP